MALLKQEITKLLRGDIDSEADCGLLLTAVVAGISWCLYGFTMGLWRSPVMGVYVALKMPLLIALTLGGNWFLNGLIGILFGSGFGFRESLRALLRGFAISGVILGSLSPVCWYFAMTMPDSGSSKADSAHAVFLLVHVALIAIAGVWGLVKLGGFLHQYCPTRGVAMKTLCAWVAGNALLGTQFSWVLRPFIGSPDLEVRLFREDAMEGSFLEAVWNSLQMMPLFNDLIYIGAPILCVILAYLFLRQVTLNKKRNHE